MPVTWVEDFLTSKWPGSILYCAGAATGRLVYNPVTRREYLIQSHTWRTSFNLLTAVCSSVKSTTRTSTVTSELFLCDWTSFHCRRRHSQWGHRLVLITRSSTCNKPGMHMHLVNFTGEKFCHEKFCCKFHGEYDSERSLRISQHLSNLWTNVNGRVFIETQCMYTVVSKIGILSQQQNIFWAVHCSSWPYVVYSLASISLSIYLSNCVPTQYGRSSEIW